MAFIGTNYDYTTHGRGKNSKYKRYIIIGIVGHYIVAMATPSIDFVVEQQEVGPLLFRTANFV